MLRLLMRLLKLDLVVIFFWCFYKIFWPNVKLSILSEKKVSRLVHWKSDFSFLLLLHFISWKVSLHFANIQNKLKFFKAKFGSFDPSYKTMILILYTWNSKHLHIRKLYLLISLYFLQVSWHDMNLKLTSGTFFDKRSWSIIL